MRKIAFFSIPAHGHTNPTLGVVRDLISRGHRVRYYSFEMMREKIEAAGAEFVSCDGYNVQRSLSPKDTARMGKDLAFSMKLLVDTTLALDEWLCEEMKEWEPDCIVADSMAIWGKAIALKLGIPFVSSTTTFAFNRHSAKTMKRNSGGGFASLIAMLKAGKQVKRLQKQGYPVKSILDIIGSDEDAHTVVYTSPEFQPCSETFSDKYAFVGPSVRSATERVEKTGEKLVYLSMGTVNNDMLPLYQRWLSELADAPYQVIMSVGDLVPLEELGAPAGNISVFPSVDQIAVLEQADVFVSHCGMNSVSESLWFGVPLVMLPQTAEQCGVAERVSQLGAGIKADAISVRSAIEKVFADESYRRRAVAISETFRRCPGAKGAADKILSVCERSV